MEHFGSNDIAWTRVKTAMQYRDRHGAAFLMAYFLVDEGLMVQVCWLSPTGQAWELNQLVTFIEMETSGDDPILAAEKFCIAELLKGNGRAA